MMELPALIEDQSTFDKLVERLLGDRVVALDTEFHCEKRYWPDLYLVQIASESVAPVAVDPLKVADLSGLGRLFAAESVVKVLHSARNDLAILFHDIPDFTVKNLFDSQIAASFLGYGDQISLVNLVHSITGSKARKKYSMSDWSARPLAEGQLEYALDDVKYLVRIYRELSSTLEKKGRMHWFIGEQEPLTRQETYAVSLEKLFSKARSAGKIKKSNFPLLWCLVKWREDSAREMNRPRHFVARDHMLCRLALLAPAEISSIERLRGLPGGFVEKYGEEVVRVTAECLRNPPKTIPSIHIPRHDWGYAARKDILRIYLKMRSKSLDLSPTLLLPKESLESILEKPPRNLRQFMSRRDLTDWRKEALGPELVQVLNGDLAISLKKGNSIRFVKVR